MGDARISENTVRQIAKSREITLAFGFVSVKKNIAPGREELKIKQRML